MSLISFERRADPRPLVSGLLAKEKAPPLESYMPKCGASGLYGDPGLLDETDPPAADAAAAAAAAVTLAAYWAVSIKASEVGGGGGGGVVSKRVG